MYIKQLSIIYDKKIYICIKQLSIIYEILPKLLCQVKFVNPLLGPIHTKHTPTNFMLGLCYVFESC